MSEIKIAATARTEFGKGAARRIRRADLVPAVIYGHGAEPQHITLPGHETMLALKHANALLSIELDGASHLAVVKDVQRDPVKGFIEHVDLLTVRQGEKITVEVPVHLVGESAPGTISVLEGQTLQLEAEATHLPEVVEVSIEGLEAGASLRAADLALPAGSQYVGDAEDVIVSITVPAVSADDAGEATGETEPGAADPEAAEEA